MIRAGDEIVADMAAYSRRDPRRWEVVVFHPTREQEKDALWEMRVVALPGERVSFSADGDILIDSKPVERPRQIASIAFKDSISRGGPIPVVHPFTIPPGCYYVLGDNVQGAYDSRFWGALPRENIVGRVLGK